MAELHSGVGSTKPIQFDQALLQRARSEVKSMLVSKPPDIEFSGEQTPRILFHGFGKPWIAAERFKQGDLNPNNELMWFTNTPQRATIYGLRIKGEWEEEVAKAGLTHYQEENHEHWYAANAIKEDARYIAIAFPYEDTDLGKWVIDKNTPTIFAQSHEYITDQGFPLEKLLFVRMDQLRPAIDDIEHGKITTRDELLERLGITSAEQTETQEKITSALKDKTAF